MVEEDPLARNPKYLALLEMAQASLLAKTQATKQTHKKLWAEYAKTLTSKYSPWDKELTNERIGQIKYMILTFVKKFRNDIGSRLKVAMLNGKINDMTSKEAVNLFADLENYKLCGVMVNAAANTKFTKWSDHVH